MPPENNPVKVELTLIATVNKGGNGASEFTEESVLLFFWDGSLKPEVD